ncbi:hypothetical protein [Candidatus Vidania fulgoroideorum]
MEKKKIIKINIRKNKENIIKKNKVKKMFKKYIKTGDIKLFNKTIGLIDKFKKKGKKEARLMRKIYRKRKAIGDSRI